MSHRFAILTLSPLLALAPAGCDRAAPPEVAPVAMVRPPVETAPGPAQIMFESTVHDFGRMSELEVRTAEYWFANSGGAPLEIKQVRTSCGCTSAVTDKTVYQPGEWGTLTAQFDPSAPGEQTKHINVITNCLPELTRLEVRARVDAFLIIDPSMLKVGTLEYGRAQRFEVTVHSPAPDFRLDRVNTSNPQMQALALEERPRSGGFVVDLTLPEDMPWGPFFSWLEVTGTGTPTGASATVTHTSKIRVQGALYGMVTADPDTFRAGVAPGEQFSRPITVKRYDGGLLTILDHALRVRNLEDAEVRIARTSDSTYSIVLTATGGPRKGTFDGRLELVTDVPGEENIGINISGSVGDSGRGVR